MLWGKLNLESPAVGLRTKMMAIHAATVGILVDKGKFEPEVALGVAEAIDLAMTQAQFVTVPILDARLHAISAEIRVLEGKLDASTQAHRSDTERLGGEYKSDMQRLRAEVRSDMQRLSAELNAKLAQMEAKLVRWVFLVMLGNVALSLAANTVLSALRSV